MMPNRYAGSKNHHLKRNVYTSVFVCMVLYVICRYHNLHKKKNRNPRKLKAYADGYSIRIFLQ